MIKGEKKMNKTEYVKAIAMETGKSQKEVKEMLEAEQKIAYAEMAKEGEVKIFDGLTLAGVKKEASTARNPLTGETINVPEKVVPKAKFGTVAKRVVNSEE